MPTTTRDSASSELSIPPSDWRGRATITVDEVAPICNLSRGSAYEAVRRGEIPSIRLGRRIVVPVAQLRRMLGEDIQANLVEAVRP